jgi:hypothetical protein
MEAKSPFLIIQDFISPLLCEQIIDDLEAYEPDVDVNGKPIKAVRSNEQYETILFEKLQEIVPTIEAHYGIEYKGTESIAFEWLPQESQGNPVCENGTYLRKKWLRTRERDVSAMLFLCDYQDKVPFDSDYEVYGGKFEFPQHGFGFNAQRGTLVLYPSDPHFINVNAPVTYGDLFQVRFQITATKPFIYNPQDFPGDYRTWFREFA